MAVSLFFEHAMTMGLLAICCIGHRMCSSTRISPVRTGNFAVVRHMVLNLF